MNTFVVVSILSCLFITVFNTGYSYPIINGTGIFLRSYVGNGAVCLDGTPGLYYINVGPNAHKFLLYFQGGGWCSGFTRGTGRGFDDCFSRRGNSLGSTKYDNDTLNLGDTFGMQRNKTINPTMFDWSYVYIRYCDGGSFTGNVWDPIPMNNSNDEYIYFRGKRILDAVIDSLINNYGLLNATDIVISGGSAGGLAAILHTNYIANIVYQRSNNNDIKIVSLPNVGYFIEYNGFNSSNPTNYSVGMEWIYVNMNSSLSINDNKCESLLDMECIFAQNIAGDNIVPTFIFNSQYDRWQTNNILGDSSNDTLISEYGYNFTQILLNNYLNKNPDVGYIYGAYIDPCHYHDGDTSNYWYGIQINGTNGAQAFDIFYNNFGKNDSTLFWFINTTYPCVGGCVC